MRQKNDHEVWKHNLNGSLHTYLITELAWRMLEMSNRQKWIKITQEEFDKNLSFVFAVPIDVDSTSCKPSPSSTTPSSNRDSGLGSFVSNSSSSFSSYPPLSSNAIAFSIENLLDLSTPKHGSSFTQLGRALRPLDLSISGLPRSRAYSCRYCSKTYSSRSSMR